MRSFIFKPRIDLTNVNFVVHVNMILDHKEYYLGTFIRNIGEIGISDDTFISINSALIIKGFQHLTDDEIILIKLTNGGN